MNIGGYQFEPVEGDPNQCMVTYFSEVETGGYLPKFICEFGVKEQCQMLYDVRKAIPKFVKDAEADGYSYASLTQHTQNK